MTTPQPAALPEPTQEQLEAFITRAGFVYGWVNLESTARRMAERAVSEIAALQPKPAEVSDADVWALWLRVCAESENLSTRVMIANFARAILALRTAQQATHEPVDPNQCDVCGAQPANRRTTPEPVGEPISVSAVATVRGGNLSWLIEGGIADLPSGAVLLVADSPITDDCGSGEVYTHPAPAPQQVPMTDQQIEALLVNWPKDGIAFFDFARAIEAHHGIVAQRAQEEA